MIKKAVRLPDFFLELLVNSTLDRSLAQNLIARGIGQR